MSLTHIDVVFSAIPKRKSVLDCHVTSGRVRFVQDVVVFLISEGEQCWTRIIIIIKIISTACEKGVQCSKRLVTDCLLTTYVHML